MILDIRTSITHLTKKMGWAQYSQAAVVAVALVEMLMALVLRKE